MRPNNFMQVVVRVRPLLEHETGRGEQAEWVTTTNTIRQRESFLDAHKNRRTAQYAFGV